MINHKGKLVTVKDSKINILSFSPLSECQPLSNINMIYSEEGLKLETLVFESFTVANLPHRIISASYAKKKYNAIYFNFFYIKNCSWESRGLKLCSREVEMCEFD